MKTRIDRRLTLKLLWFALAMVTSAIILFADVGTLVALVLICILAPMLIVAGLIYLGIDSLARFRERFIRK